MPEKSAKERVAQILIDQLGVEPETIKPEATMADLGADSLDQVEVVMAIEEEFNLEIADEDAEKLTTVAALQQYVEGRLAGNEGRQGN